ILPISLTCSVLLLSFSYSTYSTPTIFTLSLHDALPIYLFGRAFGPSLLLLTFFHVLVLTFTLRVPSLLWHCVLLDVENVFSRLRSEEHTSELQSRFDLVCRLLLEKKK